MGKTILITGKNGYIGNRLNDYLKIQGHVVDQINVRGNQWKELDFSKYNVIIHLAAIVHNNNPKATMVNYMNVNYYLTKEIAEKAKSEGVNQFIFFSTMSVFGLDGEVGKQVIINKKTLTKPKTSYGLSKLRAEEMLDEIQSNEFKVAVLRPPMIYGESAPGNFSKLIKLSNISPLYPRIDNQRSSIYIENLEIYINELIVNESSGIFHPQNNDYLNTNHAIFKMRELQNKKSISIKLPNKLLKLFGKLSIFNKLYGNLVYSKDIDEVNYNDDFITETESYIKTLKHKSRF
ncbi:NAD-dependent epimerase/dehydratase family protein [Staphylococcus arlettae]|uniref:NAD-dependent epimerase/dehydratase family protein n=1 Tax=Staphylococcus arlettae TaxID=29378 RepID=UPI0014386AB1|nr:NAD-dependent epimerase/dehydratase family protein [Staphylococcus arlettae]NKE85902.1 NAD-dependent epimerase/dehydratase family protein [Staphylococcus arlettae]URN39283.1 NAD-dependent epimerase/dehydratase family protein [Staphylococcus arlettae]